MARDAGDAVDEAADVAPDLLQPTCRALIEQSSEPERPSGPIYRSVPIGYLLNDGTPDYLRLILTSRVYEIVKETPLTPGIGLSEKLGVQVLLKREDLSPVFSFKLRGAYNKIAHIAPEDRWKGVIACSAGNHAQGVAYSARELNIPATIVMPVATPSIKINNVARMGAKVILHGNDFDDAKRHCYQLERKYGMTNIPPYDDPYVIAGQGSVAMEIIRQTDLSHLQAIFCCVGGGGLIAGVASYVKRIAPQVKIIGVETEDAAGMTASIKAGKRVELKEVGLFADGAAVRLVGEETYRIAHKLVDEMVLVTTDEICAAIKDIFEDTRSIVEPSAALAVAGLRKYIHCHPSTPDQSYVAILSGANMNFDRLRFVAERAALGEKREVFMSLLIPERPGSFITLVNKVISPRIVTEFSYRMDDPTIAAIYMSFQVTDREVDVAEVLSKCVAEGFEAEDISDNEMAKTHARYLIGGKADCPDERLIQFEFPERPGALRKFLTQMQQRESTWNISLFHYRNHGQADGKILAGIQVPEADEFGFQAYLHNLGYPWVDETNNTVYQRFMKGRRNGRK